jgi:hypothetical protein
MHITKHTDRNDSQVNNHVHLSCKLYLPMVFTKSVFWPKLFQFKNESSMLVLINVSYTWQISIHWHANKSWCCRHSQSLIMSMKSYCACIRIHRYASLDWSEKTAQRWKENWGYCILFMQRINKKNKSKCILYKMYNMHKVTKRNSFNLEKKNLSLYCCHFLCKYFKTWNLSSRFQSIQNNEEQCEELIELTPSVTKALAHCWWSIR